MHAWVDPSAGNESSGSQRVPVRCEELWTSKQRQAASIHEISYRACFKPQLPAYFIERFTRPGDVVYDPFSGRGTTAIEAALHGRRIIANDINPLSQLLCCPRLELPDLTAVETRLQRLPKPDKKNSDIDLSMFFHRSTLAEISALRAYLQQRHDDGAEDAADRWIRMVATNRLTGHSSGFFSVYTLPPNQAVSPENQVKINYRLKQRPEYRNTHAIILKKSRQLRRNLQSADITRLQTAAASAQFMSVDAAATKQIAAASVQLTVTSPPFLDVVQYARDNWLRCWFNGLDAMTIGKYITMSRTIVDWNVAMAAVFSELHRITRIGGRIAFEVGEVRKGQIRLEEQVVPLGVAAGFDCEAVLINKQRFTKTANIWGIGNNRLGTNTNRIVLFRKPA